ncbi:hypothetical protein E1281_07070 [Actinomadura sp. KC345]|uniref:hypothetical protein n=1 Tax=Actinomadura sp. KC345 TaxID=2530371 RepID=UPI00104859DB|nr:hypothetical protein [Actinomadura sp. KC345]TDC56436.1 hypothetical protein E1281_07070 [Actinomadura sp. KC345]
MCAGSNPAGGTQKNGTTGSAVGGCGWFDPGRKVKEAINGWFMDLVKSAINPEFGVVDRSLVVANSTARAKVLAQLKVSPWAKLFSPRYWRRRDSVLNEAGAHQLEVRSKPRIEFTAATRRRRSDNGREGRLPAVCRTP